MAEYYNYCNGGKLQHGTNHHLINIEAETYQYCSSGAPSGDGARAAADRLMNPVAGHPTTNSPAEYAVAARAGIYTSWAPAPVCPGPANNVPTERSALDQYSSVVTDAAPSQATWWVQPPAAHAAAAAAHGAPASQTAAPIYNIGAYPPPLQIPSFSAADRQSPAVSCATSNGHARMASVDLHVEDAPTQVDCIPADFPNGVRNNPYLTSDVPTRSTSAAWRQHQLQDWSCAEAGLPSRAHLKLSSPTAAGSNDAERGVFQPIFSDQQPHAGAYAAASVNHGRVGAVLNDRPRASPVHSSYTMSMRDDVSSNLKALDDDLQCSWGTDQGRVSVGKSQSMRALYEENAALRRALFSLRRSSAHICAMDSTLPLPTSRELSEQDRCITSDVAEGRTLSMRERGRWAMQAAAAAEGNRPNMWAGTPRRQWPPRPPLQFGLQAAGGSHHRRPCRSIGHESQWWDEDVTTEHPLFSLYGGGSFGGWPEESEPMCWSDQAGRLQNECATGSSADQEDHEELARLTAAGIISGRSQGTSLKQLLGRAAAHDGRAAAAARINCSTRIADLDAGSQKWRRRAPAGAEAGRKKDIAARMSRSAAVCTAEEEALKRRHVQLQYAGNGSNISAGHQITRGGARGPNEQELLYDDERQAQHCAMCGGRLRQVQVDGVGGCKSSSSSSGGGAGLPLRLCPACHPRAAASLPHSTRSPPAGALPASHRHHVATAVLMACRPNPTSCSTLDPPPKSDPSSCTSTSYTSRRPVKPARTSRFLDLCRHFVGLSSPSSSNSR